MKVYADNSATSFPKAPGVSDAVKDFMDNIGCNINRGGYGASYGAAMDILATRQLLCKLVNAPDPRNVIFTPGITYSLNMILKGFLRAGDHVITTSMEHNGVMRPLHELKSAGVTYDIAWCDKDGNLDAMTVAKMINPRTKAVVMTHASNVCGRVLPIYDIAEICTARGIKLIVDTAQTLGSLAIDWACVDALAFTCHKGLLAPQGLGGFVIKSDMAACMDPIITGGTGSKSHEIAQPTMLPDKFEPGTMNIPAIMGLRVALEYILSVGVDTIYAKEMALAEAFINEVSGIESVRVIGKGGSGDKIAVVSLDFVGRDNAEIAAALDINHGVMVRCGLHCSPMAHKTLGTYPHGTVRFSFGHFNSACDIEYIVCAIKECIKMC